MSRKATYLLFSSIVFVLVVSLIFSVTVVIKKNNHITEIKQQIARNEKLIDEQQEKQKELEAKLKGSEEEKNKISSQLDAAQKEKNKLEEENKKLKTEIAKLKAQKPSKKPAAQSAVGTTSKPAVMPPTNTNKVCYLTFDDGPSDNTLKILKILDRYGVKATFFVMNSDKAAYLKNIHDAGHTIGLHTYSHVYSSVYKSVDAYFADLQKISNVVEKHTGVKSFVIRFPGGSSNSVSKKYCNGIMSNLSKRVQEKGYSYFDWNVSSEDASGNRVSYTRIRDSVLNGANGKNNICVLMHDSSAKTTTVDALPYIIEGLSKKGFRFEALTKDTTPTFRHGILN